MNTLIRYFYAWLTITFLCLIIISYKIGRYYAVEPCNNNSCPVKLEVPPVVEPIVEPIDPAIYSILVPDPESFKPGKKPIPTGVLNVYN